MNLFSHLHCCYPTQDRKHPLPLLLLKQLISLMSTCLLTTPTKSHSHKFNYLFFWLLSALAKFTKVKFTQNIIALRYKKRTVRHGLTRFAVLEWSLKDGRNGTSGNFVQHCLLMNKLDCVKWNRAIQSSKSNCPLKDVLRQSSVSNDKWKSQGHRREEVYTYPFLTCEHVVKLVYWKCPVKSYHEPCLHTYPKRATPEGICETTWAMWKPPTLSVLSRQLRHL